MNYFKPILLIGYIIPLTVAVLLFAGLFFGKTWIDGEFERRKTAFDGMRENEKKAEILEAKVLPLRGAVAFFEEAKKAKISQEIPTLLEDLSSGKYQGYVIRTQLQTGEDGGKETFNMEFLGRYDAMQRLASELVSQFPYLRFSSGSFTPKSATTSVPSNHISGTFKAYNDPGTSGEEEAEGGDRR